MGYFEGLISAAYEQKDGNYYIVGLGAPRRFLSAADYERSRERLTSIYRSGMGIIVAVGVVASLFGFLWAIIGLGIALSWFYSFGRAMVTVNSVAADFIYESKKQRMRIAHGMGSATLWKLTAGCALFTLLGIFMIIGDPEAKMLGIVTAGFFGFGMISIGLLAIQSGKPDGAVVHDASSAPETEPPPTGAASVLSVTEKEPKPAQVEVSEEDGHPVGSSPAGRPWRLILGVGVGAALVGAGFALLFVPMGPSTTFVADTDDTGAVPSDNVVAAGPEIITGFTLEESNQIKKAADAWSDYRNAVPNAYERHSTLLEQLWNQGICWGRTDQAQAEYDYHRCDSGSIQNQPLPEAQAATETTETRLGTPGRCFLRINGVSYIDGNCINQVDTDGSFQINATDGSYMAAVLLDGTIGEGYWNGTNDGKQADIQLGAMTRTGACWENETAKICAWQQ